MKYFLLFLSLTFINNSFSQEIKKCYTTELINNELVSNPNYQVEINNVWKQNKNWLKSNNISKQTITIPVVIHVIYRQNHSNLGIGTNIPNIQIEDQLRILNEDFSKTNSEFPNPPRNTFVNYAGNANIQFCLATTDPNGNPTDGITRTLSSKNSFNYNTESNDMKRNSTGGKNGWPPGDYMNIWVCDIASQGNTTVLGYAYLPGLQSWNAWKDGLVVDFQYFGTTGNASSTSDGRTPTHEIGHYLGLNHTFCEAQSGGCCDNDNSNVYDTPATDDVYFGNVNASTNNNTCNDLQYGFNSDLLDMDENFMAYSRDTWMFSNDQVNEMISTMNGYRSSLKNSNVTVNCTGIVNSEFVELNKLFSFFPNPAKNSVSIKSSELNYRLILFDMLGNEVKNWKNLNNNTKIDISNLNSGVYLINFISDTNHLTKRLTISK